MKREECFQVQLVHWFRFQYPDYAELLTLGSFGENVGAIRMKRLKQMGLSPGFPDLFLAVPAFCNPNLSGFHFGLFLELKTKTGSLSKEQKTKHELLRKHHYKVEVVRSFDEGMKAFKDYLET